MPIRPITSGSSHSRKINPKALLTLTLGLSIHAISAQAQSCQQQEVKLQVLGSGGPELNDDRASSSYLIWHKNKAKVLIDAGPGSSVNFGAAQADFADLKVVAYHIKAQNIPLTPIKQHSLKIDEDITITATPVHHGPISALAWRVDIDGCGITFSGDMNNKFNVLAALGKDSDILVMHNAVPQDASGAAINLHMRPVEIGKIAQQANAKTVLLSHFMNRTINDNAATLGYIRQNFAGEVKMATDMATF